MSDAQERFEWCHCTVNDGRATFRYRVKGAEVDGSDTHDEDVSDWSDDDLRDLARDIVGVPEDQLDDIEITWN